MRRLIAGVFFTWLLCLGGKAQAIWITPPTYDELRYQHLFSAPSIETFDSLAAGPTFSTTGTFGSAPFSWVATSSAGGLYIDNTFFPDPNNHSLTTEAYGSSITVNFTGSASPINAFGGFFALAGAGAGTDTLSLVINAGADSPGPIIVNSAGGFFGFVSDANISSVTISTSNLANNSVVIINDFISGFGTTEVIPEPGVLLSTLLAAGLIGGRVTRRRKGGRKDQGAAA